MKRNKIIKAIAQTALFSALTFICTIFISIPYAGGAGYFNLSDSVILFSTIFCGPYVGIISGIIGTVLGDIALNFAIFAPFTFFAKGLEAVLCFLIYYLLRKTKYVKYISVFISPIIMVLTYLIANSILFDFNYALGAMGFDFIQGLAGSIISFTLINIFERTTISHFDYNNIGLKEGKKSF